MIRKLYHRVVCWIKGICPIHNKPYSYRTELRPGPMAGYYCCDQDPTPTKIEFCQECEEVK